MVGIIKLVFGIVIGMAMFFKKVENLIYPYFTKWKYTKRTWNPNT